MENTPRFTVAAMSHPSLDGRVERFAAALRSETRYFGRQAASAPKPMPSLVTRLTGPDAVLRIAAVADGEVIGLAAVDESAGRPELLIAVDAAWRGRGVGTQLAAAAIEQAGRVGCTHVVVRASRRHRSALAIGQAMGFAVIDRGRGRVDLVRELGRRVKSA